MADSGHGARGREELGGEGADAPGRGWLSRRSGGSVSGDQEVSCGLPPMPAQSPHSPPGDPRPLPTSRPEPAAGRGGGLGWQHAVWADPGRSGGLSDLTAPPGGHWRDSEPHVAEAAGTGPARERLARGPAGRGRRLSRPGGRGACGLPGIAPGRAGVSAPTQLSRPRVPSTSASAGGSGGLWEIRHFNTLLMIKTEARRNPE